MLVRLLEIIIIIAAIGGGLFFVRWLLVEFRAARDVSRADRENRRAIAISKGMEALKKRDRWGIELALSLNGKDMSPEFQKKLRDALVDIAYDEAINPKR